MRHSIDWQIQVTGGRRKTSCTPFRFCHGRVARSPAMDLASEAIESRLRAGVSDLRSSDLLGPDRTENERKWQRRLRHTRSSRKRANGRHRSEASDRVSGGSSYRKVIKMSLRRPTTVVAATSGARYMLALMIVVSLQLLHLSSDNFYGEGDCDSLRSGAGCLAQAYEISPAALSRPLPYQDALEMTDRKTSLAAMSNQNLLQLESASASSLLKEGHSRRFKRASQTGKSLDRVKSNSLAGSAASSGASLYFLALSKDFHLS